MNIAIFRHSMLLSNISPYGKPTDTLSEAINDRIEAVPRTIDCARIVQETII